ncbi:3-oxoacyl-ACP reductase FabG [Virgibacillus dokdonensis]|uniref:3-oxoacyl-[acyl-carrier-protein] reductase FabG n=1 Tax=Virgibacillus dokdonensis TaxID=302167 RepID=A0A2K9IZ13_9BACI|nr:3-oxoacyl-ACP reductase FabG [Virgibacillus dokdonensis]AUJ24958.1 3-oxoacyl-[acyl-carrier-protein] reductase FabG [Virgibacillus dokdonensis]
MMKQLKDKVVVVTGGAQGLGKAMCERFAYEGAEVVYSLDLQKGNLTADNVRHQELDVTNIAEIDSFIQSVKEAYGRIDVLVNNAGVTRDALTQKMDDNKWESVMDINLKGVFHMTKAIAPIMMENGSGSIINISSIVGLYGNIGQANYAATKAGVIGMSYTWAKEFTRKGAAVRTNVIAPGFIETDMMKAVPEKVLQPLRDQTPLKRLGLPEEVANAALFLASDESSYVNGHVLSVDGGLRL